MTYCFHNSVLTKVMHFESKIALVKRTLNILSYRYVTTKSENREASVQCWHGVYLHVCLICQNLFFKQTDKQYDFCGNHVLMKKTFLSQKKIFTCTHYSGAFSDSSIRKCTDLWTENNSQSDSQFFILFTFILEK